MVEEQENKENSGDYHRDYADAPAETRPELVSKSLNHLPTERERERERQLVSTILTNYLTEISGSDNRGVSKQIENLVTNLEESTTLLREIGEILARNETIKATSFLFLLKHRLIWGGAMTKLFPQLTARQMIERFRTEERKGFCFELQDGDNRFEREKRILGRIIETQQNAGRFQVNRVRWFGVTDQGFEIIKLFKKHLGALLTEDIRKKIKDPHLSFLYHTHKEHEYVELQKQKAENRELEPIRTEIIRLSGMERKNVDKQLQGESERTGERRLPIAKRWLEDLRGARE